MPELDDVAEVLVGCRAITRPQWDQAARAGDDDLSAVLDALAKQRPHWWDGKPPAPPGLTEFQRDMIEARFADDELDQLARDLARNQFLLLGKLGEGGQGAVYRGRQLNPPRYAAVKTLTRDTEASRRRFEQEARTMMKVQHPSVARFYLYERVRDDDGEPTDEYLIAMELVHGTDLHRLIRKTGPVPWPFAVKWAIDLLGGLAAIHDTGIIHRDVKPENVMVVGPDPGPGVDPDRTAAKLLDFGAVRPHDGNVGDGIAEGRVFVGTPEYAPPEQWAGKICPASDLYSLGGTLFYMFTGGCPYQKERRDAFAYRASHTREPVPDLSAVNPDIPTGVNRLFRKMMAKKPDDRGTAAELAEEFGRLLLSAAPEPPRGKSPAVRPRSLPGSVTSAAGQPGRVREVDAGPRNPLARLFNPVLSLLERIFIPRHSRPRAGAEMPLGDRLTALLRRPLVLLTLLAFVAVLVLLIRK